jgi:hypothetical protein
VCDGTVRGENIFWKALQATSKVSDIVARISHFSIQGNDISRENQVDVYTNTISVKLRSRLWL